MNRIVGLFSLLLVVGVCSAAGRTVVEWTFDTPSDLQGWRPNEHLKAVVVTNGVLAGDAAGHDPILELESSLEFPASARQMVEIRLKADADGEAQLFWSNTSVGPYRGFEGRKSTRFRVCGDGTWRVYRFLPGWHPEGKIVRLRFDVYDAARFELDYIRFVELDAPDSTLGANFDFAKSGHGWQWLETVTTQEPERRSATGFRYADSPKPAQSRRPDSGAPVAWNGEQLDCPAAGLLLSPPLRLDADQQTLATVCMAVNRGTYGTLFFINEAKAGLQRLTFPIVADGDEHFYHLDLLTNTNWAGRIVALGLQPSDATNVTVKLRSFKVGDATQTAPQLAVSFFALEDALPRAGVPCKLLAVVRNSGGSSATNLVAKLRLPAGVKLSGAEWTHRGVMKQPTPDPSQEGNDHSARAVRSPPLEGLGVGSRDGDVAEKRSARLGLGKEARFEWIVQAERPLDGKIRLTLTAANAEKLKHAMSARFTARLSTRNMDYVPEPKPARGPFEVGAYYFPGWKNVVQWQPIQNFPERKPVLGWYREGEPEVADWHIKWAVEHGITFFAYDWYWSQGRRQLEHALHDGYFKARYRHLLKFCLLWANHNPPNSSSPEDCLAVTRYWIENYFRRPEHLTFDGKPVVIIFSPERLTADLGSANVKRALNAMREECRRASLKGLYLTACVADAGGAKIVASEGYDAITAYNWPGVGMTGDGLFASFETLIPGYRRRWENLSTLRSAATGDGLVASPIPQMPLPACGGWDSRPWHGEHGLVRFGRTPALFKRHLLDAKQFLEAPGVKGRLPKMVLVEAWNEWGEGSYIEPHQQFGFGYLDAIREVFTDAPKVHADMTPADVGLRPYDVTIVPQ